MKARRAFALLRRANPVPDSRAEEWAAGGSANDLYARVVGQPIEAHEGHFRKPKRRVAASTLLAAVSLLLVGTAMLAVLRQPENSVPKEPGGPVASVPVASAPLTTARVFAPLSRGATQSTTPTSTEHDSPVDGMNFLSAQIREAQVIVWGRVVGVEAPRWNSPDGKEWHGTTDGELPILYVTYAVEPTEVWKGPQASGLVLLLGPAEIRPDDGATGSDGGLPGGGLAVVDEVVSFGVAKPHYVPTADDA